MKNKRRQGLLSVIIVLLMMFSVGCTKNSPAIETPTPAPTAAVSTVSPTASAETLSSAEGVLAYKHIRNLADGIGARPDGTPAAATAALYINGELRKLGYETVEQSFQATVKRMNKDTQITSKNIIAEKKGTGKGLLIIGGHYDSVELGDGADDNASSIGVLLELAERLKKIDTPCAIRFIAFGAEEDGLLGSAYYVSTLKTEELKSISNMINLDTLLSGNKLYVYGDFGEKGVLREAALKASKELNLELITQSGTKDYPAGTTGPFSDHVPFTEKGVPYTYFESTDWDLGEKDGYTQVDAKYGVNGEIWHTKYDTLEYINETFPGRSEAHLQAFIKVLMKIIPEFQP